MAAKILSFTWRDRPYSFALHPPLGNALENGIFHEANTSQLFMDLLEKGDTFIDIGANTGYFALLANTMMEGEGRVLAFEPNPFTYVRLASNIAVNRFHNVLAFNAAVGDRSGVATLAVAPDLAGTSHLVAGAAEGPVVTCATVTLDDICADLGLDRIKAVKIDAEGYEIHILHGARGLLARRCVQHYVCEVNSDALRRCGTSQGELRRLMDAAGYDAEIINPGTHDLCGGAPRRRYPLSETVDPGIVFNVLFTRRD